MFDKTSYFKSSSLKLETSNENDESGIPNLVYLENDEYIPQVEEDHPISFEDFKKIVRQRVIDFTHSSFDNVIVLAGAGASIVIGDDGKPYESYGKTVAMIAKKINCELKLNGNFYNLQELADKSK
ncbi:SIR2 family protein, partial [Listeria monocytogenes]|nr:SIR2 family protein [Listeria monocytogenes]